MNWSVPHFDRVSLTGWNFSTISIHTVDAAFLGRTTAKRIGYKSAVPEK